MNSSQVIKTVIEIVLVGFAVWAVFHEDMFIAFEERFIANRKRKQLRVIREANNTVD